MSIRSGLLALLENGPMYGYQLRTEFELRTGGTWPLNIGQVYTTLGRLERDGLVLPAAAATGGGDGTQRRYSLTDAGHAEVDGWFRTPVERTTPPRNELAIKLALALTVPGVDVCEVIRRQRTATMRTMRDYTRLKLQADEQGDVAWLLVLDSLVFQAEAEIRWLDHCESRVTRFPAESASRTRGGTGGPPGASSTRAATEQQASR